MNARWPWTVGNIHLLPVLHGRIEFCVAVRNAVAELQPDVVAIEFPAPFESLIVQGINRLPLLSAVQFETPLGLPGYVLIEPLEPLIEAARCAREMNIPLRCVDRNSEWPPSDTRPWPDSYAVLTIGLESYVETYLNEVGDAPPSLDSPEMIEEHLREVTMAYHLQTLADSHQRVLCVVGLAHLPALRRLLPSPQAEPLGVVHRPDACLVHIHADSTREILSENAYAAASYERWRMNQIPTDDSAPRRPIELQSGERTAKSNVIVFPGQSGDLPQTTTQANVRDRSSPPISPCQTFDRWEIVRHLLAEARLRYEREDGERLSPLSIHNFMQFSRNLTLLDSNQLVPDLYQLVLAARGVGGDDFAYRLWEIATEYPWQDDAPRMPVARISLENLGKTSKRVSFERSLDHQKRLRRIIRERPKERYPGEWRKFGENDFICSYPPEDIRIESYGHFLQSKARTILSEERTRTEPFTGSMLDGIDLRETLRHWYENKIYVRECLKVQGQVGSVIVIFDEGPTEPETPHRRYPWTMTWQGEHEQESDMALYATPPQAHPVGPGIFRCEYGGFLMSYPPGRMFHVWEDPCFDLARNKAERLLLAGLDYSEERYIVYVAKNPPRSWYHHYASRLHRKIIYIPLGSLSQSSLKRLRIFHVLANHSVRAQAKDYIW